MVCSTNAPPSAINRLLAGPAAATSAKSRRGERRLRKSTGTGLAHPISGSPVIAASSGNSKVPIGSMCATGLRVRRPRSRAVGSPS